MFSTLALCSLHGFNICAIEHDLGYPKTFHFFMVLQHPRNKVLVRRDAALDCRHRHRCSCCSGSVLFVVVLVGTAGSAARFFRVAAFFRYRDSSNVFFSLRIFHRSRQDSVQRFFREWSNLDARLGLLGFRLFGAVSRALADHIQTETWLVSAKQRVVECTRIRSSCCLAKSPETIEQRQRVLATAFGRGPNSDRVQLPS